jgi:hypothetical protein
MFILKAVIFRQLRGPVFVLAVVCLSLLEALRFCQWIAGALFRRVALPRLKCLELELYSIVQFPEHG